MWHVSAGRRVWMECYIEWLLLCCSNFMCYDSLVTRSVYMCIWLINIVCGLEFTSCIDHILLSMCSQNTIMEHKNAVWFVPCLSISIHLELSGSSCLDNKRGVMFERREKIVWTRGIWGVSEGERENEIIAENTTKSIDFWMINRIVKEGTDEKNVQT